VGRLLLGFDVWRVCGPAFGDEKAAAMAGRGGKGATMVQMSIRMRLKCGRVLDGKRS
jgi:hypothetical protein